MVNAKAWAEMTFSVLIDRVKNKGPVEIEETSFDYVNDEFKPDEKMHLLIGQAANDYRVETFEVLAVLAIALSNRLLSARSCK